MVAGPSGSGKSTFMRELVHDRLPRDISDHLPIEARAWQCTSANELSRNSLAGVRARRGGTPGLIVHYDIMRPYSKRFERYDNDPAIKQLVSAGSALTVITLAPNREVLLEQFLKRAADPDYVEWWGRNRWTRRLKQKLRAAIYRLTGKQPKLLKEEQLRLLGVYASKNGLKQWLAEWESFLEGLRRGSPGARLVYVTPEQLQHDFPRLRLFRLDQTRGRSGMATGAVDRKSQACACPNVRFEYQTEQAHTLDAQPISSTPL